MMAIEQRNLVNKLSPIPYSKKYSAFGAFSPAPKLKQEEDFVTPSTGEVTPKQVYHSRVHSHRKALSLNDELSRAVGTLKISGRNPGIKDSTGTPLRLSQEFKGVLNSNVFDQTPKNSKRVSAVPSSRGGLTNQKIQEAIAVA